MRKGETSKKKITLYFVAIVFMGCSKAFLEQGSQDQSMPQNALNSQPAIETPTPTAMPTTTSPAPNPTNTPSVTPTASPTPSPTPTMTPTPTPTPAPLPNKIAFVTTNTGGAVFSTWSSTLTGGKSGVAAADQICQTEANTAGLTGTFAAWISSSTRNARDVFAGESGGWRTRAPGSPVFAESLSELVAGRVLNPIQHTAAGSALYTSGTPAGTDYNTITGTLYTGLKDTNAGNTFCSDWTSTASGSSGYASGSTRSAGPYWTYPNTFGICSNTGLRLYCLQKGNGAATVHVPNTTAKVAFVTSKAGKGNFLGTDWQPENAGANSGSLAADKICQYKANAAGLSNANNFAAWVSTSTINAIDKFTPSAGPYRNTRGAMISSTLSALAVGSMNSTIAFDELGNPVLINQVISTGTLNGGQRNSNANCNNWQLNDSSTLHGFAFPGTGGQKWTEFATGSCNMLGRIICIEK